MKKHRTVRRRARAHKPAKHSIEIGSKVEAGRGDDYDTGRVFELERQNGMRVAWVAWDTGVRTWIPVSMLRKIAG
jgi:hypothetical protein